MKRRSLPLVTKAVNAEGYQVQSAEAAQHPISRWFRWSVIILALYPASRHDRL
ncbi:MAG: hypothetical protein R2881_05550 [Eubacteriales bacterium]